MKVLNRIHLLDEALGLLSQQGVGNRSGRRRKANGSEKSLVEAFKRINYWFTRYCKLG